MARKISLTKGKFAIVDDDDFEWLSQYNWYASGTENNFYAARRLRKKKRRSLVYMHRQIMGLTSGDLKQIDHINSITYDNRRINLRISTQGENVHNQSGQSSSSSKYKGVSWYKPSKKWRVRIQVNGKYHHIGHFDNELEAAKAYDKKARELFGEFAKLNF